MSAEGYRQAIENFVYEVDRLAENIDNMPGSISAKTVSLLTRDEVFQQYEEQFRALDAIVTVIASTYHRSEKEVEANIDQLMRTKILNAITEVTQ